LDHTQINKTEELIIKEQKELGNLCAQRVEVSASLVKSQFDDQSV